jgi:hypothetical protein
MSTETDLNDEDVLYTKLERLGCRSWKDLQSVLTHIGMSLDPGEAASRAHLRAAYDHLKTKRPKKGQSHG